MSEKIGISIGVPSCDPLPTGSGGGLADGYYYQLDVAEPRTATGWTAGPNLHDLANGDLTTFYQTAPGTTERSMVVLVAKGTGMTFNRLQASPGYPDVLGLPLFYGSNDLVAWTSLATTLSAGFIHFTMTYGVLDWDFSSTHTFKYLAFLLRVTGGSNPQVGCADVRVRNGGAEVGP